MAILTRREALAGAGTNLMIARPEAVFGSQANSAVPFGIIGTGGRGTYVGGHMARDPRARRPSATFFRIASTRPRPAYQGPTRRGRTGTTKNCWRSPASTRC